MGLQERRRIQQLLEEKLPQITQRFQEETGLSIPIEVDAASLEAIPNMEGLNTTLDWVGGEINDGEFWSEQVAAWNDLASDDLGRATIGERVKALRVTYVPDAPTDLRLVDGVMVYNVNFVSEGTSARLWRGPLRERLLRALTVDGLNLDQRRSLQEIREQIIPRFQAELRDSCGVDLPVSLHDNFAQMPDDESRDSSLDWLRGAVNDGEFFGELLRAFQHVCADTMGKDAVSQKIKRIELRWEVGRAAGLALQDGVLTYYYNWADSPGAHRLFASEIRSTLEGLL
jgi:hypothetical protein